MKKKTQKNDTFKLMFIITFSFVIGGVIMFSLLKWTPLISEVVGTSDSTIITKNGTQVYEKGSLAASIDKIYDAVVVVEGFQNGELASTGSGFVYKVDQKYGYVLTNQHVVEDMKEIKLIMSDETEVDAKVLGGNEYLDLAVLQMDKSKVKLVANIGNSEKMNLGDTIFTVGSPMGIDYMGSVTSGILSGKDRIISVSTSDDDRVMRVLQIDASINPGNSGGPLLNINGEVIGICSMKLVDAQIEGMGFAIPIEYAMSHVDTLEAGKEIEWPLLGITMINVTDVVNLYRENIQIDKNIKEGVVVLECSEGTGAAKSDLKRGDVIIKINKTETKDIGHLRYALYQHKAGETIDITYIRDGKEHVTKVTLGKNTKKN